MVRAPRARDEGRVPASRVLLISCSGAFLAFLDATIVNVAFPSIRESFPDSTIGSLSWVLNAYNITFAALLIVCGRFADLLGRRRMFVAGVLVFTVASVLCALAPSVVLLVAARVLQAGGAALLVPASLALVIEAFPDDRRTHAIGLWGATAAVAAGLGPPIGGALVEMGDWRWAFLVNVPFGAAAVLAARRHLVESRAPGRRVLPDLRGALLLAACLTLLNLGIVKGDDWGWGSPRVLGSITASVVLLAAFVMSSRRHRSPLLDPALLRLPSFSVATTATVVAGLGFYAYLLTNILWLQYVWGYDVLRAGLALVPAALVAAVVAAKLGPLAETHGYRPFVVPGALVWAGAYLWYHQQVGTTPAFWSEWLPGQVLSGIGVGATLPLLGSAALAAVPRGRYATASAVVSSARQLGGVLGIAVLVVILGDPTPANAVEAFRDGWTLSIVAFLAVAALALPLGRLGRHDEDDHEVDEAPRVQLPATVTAPPGGTPSAVSEIPLVAALPESVRRRLDESARVHVVRAGQWLMRQGDPPGSAYVVRGGRLEVHVAGRPVRELGPGAVLGELSLLTGEERSADVRARRDTTLLEIPRDSFERLVGADAAAQRAVLTQTAQRLRTAGGPTPTERPAQPSVVAVIGLPGLAGDDTASLVAEALRHRLGTHLRVVAPGRVDTEQLDRAESDADRVLLVADDGAPGSDETAWREFCLRQADVVVLVARSDAAPPSSPPEPAPARAPELVLVGTAPLPDLRARWVATTDAWQLTLVRSEHLGDLAADLRGLADRIAARAWGLVLAGGGARAFAHVGVLRELEERGVHVDRVAGTSLGAIVAGGHALGFDGAELEDRCYNAFVRRNPFNDWRLPTHSLAGGHRVRAGLERAFGADTVLEGLPRQMHAASTDLVSRTRVTHRRGLLVDATLASARLPVLFAPLPDTNGRLLVDGGVLDNLPADLLTERDEGPVVAVNIAMGGGGGSGRSRSGPPRVPALGETLLRTMMIGSGGAVAAAHARGVPVVTPPTLGVGLLEFHQFDRMVHAGRQAARALLEALDGRRSDDPDMLDERGGQPISV